MSITKKQIYRLMREKVKVSVAVRNSIDDVHTPPGLFLNSLAGEDELPVVVFSDSQKGLLYVELGDLTKVDVRPSKRYEGVTELLAPDYHIQRYASQKT